MTNAKNPYNRLLIVANRLPFSVKQTSEGTELIQSAGGLVSAVLSMAEQMGQSGDEQTPKIHWVGYADAAVRDLEATALENDNFVAHPVYIDDATYKDYYEGFCNDLIWPLFHYFPSFASFQDVHFERYQQANARFADKVREIARPGDLIWVHDFQPMLLPGMIRQAIPEATLGYFFPIPFPTYEIVKLLPRTWRQALLNGLTGANVIGFHTADYVQHFMQSVTEVLGLPILGNRIVLPDRSVIAGDFPISIDFNKFNMGAQTSAVLDTKTRFREELRTQKVIFSVDRLDYAKGITYRLQGYERFLTQNPEWHNKFTFVMTVVPSRDQIRHYQALKREIEETVGRLNGLFGTIGWRPIVYSYMSLSFTELLALYTACDIALITPIRDGMNLVCKEFIASRSDDQGVLILSEFAGAAQELTDALLINPTDTQEVADAIQQAISMPADEQAARMHTMRRHIQNHNVFRWSHQFLTVLDESITLKTSIETNLPLVSFCNAFEGASRRLLLFDFDGTLSALVDNPADARLSDGTAAALQRLSETCELVVISGRNRAFLENTFRHLPVHLVAEHGAFLKQPKQDWQRLDLTSENWIDSVKSIMQPYVDQFPGSFIESKETTIAWHYRMVQQDDSELNAVELASQLRNLPISVPLTVIQGNKFIEVKPAHHSKGTVAQLIVEQTPFDFIVSIGDDTTDEDMFRQLPNWAYTIKVGPGHSFARYRLARQIDVDELLAQMSKIPVVL